MLLGLDVHFIIAFVIRIVSTRLTSELLLLFRWFDTRTKIVPVSFQVALVRKTFVSTESTGCADEWLVIPFWRIQASMCCVCYRLQMAIKFLFVVCTVCTWFAPDGQHALAFQK